jgi:hypothetical protein
MASAKASARSAGGSTQQSASYIAATAAEREALRLERAGRFTEATAKFYEAVGLFRSAEVVAAAAGPVPQPQPVEPPAVPPVHETPQPAPAAQQAASSSVPTAPPPQSEPAQPTASGAQPGGSGAADKEAAPAAQPSPGAAPPPLDPIARPPAAPPRPATELSTADGIRDLLRRYELALESRSIEALRRVWPSLSGAQEVAIRNEFVYARRIEVGIENVEQSISGATGTVTFIRRYQLSTIDGQQPFRLSRTTMSVRRTGNEWIIERVRFEALQ